VIEARGRYAHVRPKEYVSGEQVLYLGRRYVLKVVPVDKTVAVVRLKGNRLEADPKLITQNQCVAFNQRIEMPSWQTRLAAQTSDFFGFG
jgi:hypothetical protein